MENWGSRSFAGGRVNQQEVYADDIVLEQAKCLHDCPLYSEFGKGEGRDACPAVYRGKLIWAKPERSAIGQLFRKAGTPLGGSLLSVSEDHRVAQQEAQIKL